MDDTVSYWVTWRPIGSHVQYYRQLLQLMALIDIFTDAPSTSWSTLNQQSADNQPTHTYWSTLIRHSLACVQKSVDSQLTVDQDKLIECQPSVNRGVNWISIEYQLLVLIEDIYWHSTVDAFSTQNLTNMHWALIYSWYDVINSDACRTHLIWFHWNNGAQCEDEWMDVLHVKVVSGNSIRDWVISQFLLCRKKHW